MLESKKLYALVLSICMLWSLALPAFAADPQVTKKDLKGISPQRHRYAFAVIGGAAVGAGLGAAFGPGWTVDIAKGLLIGSGGSSAIYLHVHRKDDMGGWRNWAYLGSYTALGGGIGWTVCGCNTGLATGLLLGSGGTAIWLSENPQRTHPVATNVPPAPAPQPSAAAPPPAGTQPPDYEVAAGEEVKTSGLITHRSGEAMTVKTSGKGSVVVLLTNHTKVEQSEGLFKIRGEEMEVTALIPGLEIDLEGIGDGQGRVIAQKVKFSQESLETAMKATQIRGELAGAQPQVEGSQQAVAENRQAIGSNQAIATNEEAFPAKQDEIHQESQGEEKEVSKRFADLTDYDTKDAVTLYYAPGGADLDPKQQAELSQLAQKAAGLKTYLIQVVGYTDSSGGAAFNTKLSEERAGNVVRYLQENAKIPLTNIMAPSAMGETGNAAPNETTQGRAENRRVVAKLLVDKGKSEQDALRASSDITG